MTAVVEVPRQAQPVDAPQPVRPAPRQPAHPPRAAARSVGFALVALALLLAGFLVQALYLTPVSEARAQENLFKTFRGALSQGLAPVGPAALGDPVAVLEVPRVHLKAVVVEGSASAQLLDGPGHRPDTPLPGQPGASVVLGRRSLAGAPFADLASLQVGDTITATTGQSGGIRYRVTSVRRSTEPRLVRSDDPRNTLTLVTADPPLHPTRTVIVTAALQTPVLAAGAPRPAARAADASLARDGGGLLPLALWGQVLVLVALASTWAYVRWSRWPSWLVTTPVLLAVLWNVYENALRLLPNVL